MSVRTHVKTFSWHSTAEDDRRPVSQPERGSRGPEARWGPVQDRERGERKGRERAVGKAAGDVFIPVRMVGLAGFDARPRCGGRLGGFTGPLDRTA